MNRTNSHIVIGAIVGVIYSYVLVWSSLVALSVQITLGGSSYDFVMGSMFSFLRAGLPFLLLHLPLLVVIGAVLPRKRARFLPLLSGLMAVLVGLSLRRLSGTEFSYGNDYSAFERFMMASIVTGIVAGFFYLREAQFLRQTTKTVAIVATIGVCLPCFLYFYFVNPGRYVEDAHGNNRVDWLTGRREDCHAQGDECHWQVR